MISPNSLHVGFANEKQAELQRLREEVASLRAYASNLEQAASARENNYQSEINSIKNRPNEELLRLQRENKDLKQMLLQKEKDLIGRAIPDQNYNQANYGASQMGAQQRGGFSSVGRPALLEQKPISQQNGYHFMNESHHWLDGSVYFTPYMKPNQSN